MKTRSLPEILISLFLLAGLPLHAQEGDRMAADESRPAAVPITHASPPQGSASGRFLRDLWVDQKAIWTSPVRINHRQFFTIALPLAASTAALIAVDESAANGLPDTQGQLRWSRRMSTAGAITLGGIVGGSMLVGKVKGESGAFQVGRLSAEAFIDSFAVSQVIKRTTARERPDQNDGQGRFWKGGQGFPSGHAINSWAVATVVARSPKCPKWLAITSYGVATVVSLSRSGARKHFPSDILVGSVLGGLIGNYVATRPR